MQLIPKDLLFPCVTGYFDYSDRQAVRTLIYSGIQLKSTCKSMNERISECWKEVLKESPSFLLNWIEGKPKITQKSLCEMLNESFCVVPENIPDSVPTSWASLQDIHAYTTDAGAAFFNTTTKKFLGEILSEEGLKLILKPIFYKNEVILLFEGEDRSELKLYEIGEEKLLLKKSSSFFIGKIKSIDLLNDHLIFLTREHNYQIYHLAALSVEDFRNLDRAKFIARNFIWPYKPTLKFFKEKFVMFWEADIGVACLTMYIQEKSLEFKTHPVERKYNTQVQYHDSFFLFTDYDREHVVSAVAKDALDSLEKPLSFIYSPPQKGFGKLVPFKDFTILCSGEMGSSLKFQVPSFKEGKIELTPLEINNASDYKFNRLDRAYAHLDKIFLIGVLRAPNPSNHLVIVDMKTRSIENKYLLELDMRPEIVTASLGCLYIFNPVKQNILQIKY